jgi:hypothetical protein
MNPEDPTHSDPMVYRMPDAGALAHRFVDRYGLSTIQALELIDEVCQEMRPVKQSEAARQARATHPTASEKALHAMLVTPPSWEGPRSAPPASGERRRGWWRRQMGVRPEGDRPPLRLIRQSAPSSSHGAEST